MENCLLQEGHKRAMAGNKSPLPQNPAAGGPFAAVATRQTDQFQPPSHLQGKGMERTPSHQSLNTISPNTSSALGLSAGSTYDEVTL